MRAAYFQMMDTAGRQLPGGIAGDMVVASFIDCLPEDGKQDIIYYLEENLRKLKGLENLSLLAPEENRPPVYGTNLNFILPEKESHHAHDHHAHHHSHHHYTDIRDNIEKSGLSEYVKTFSKKAFEILAEAERQAHGKRTIDEVAFHQVGEPDSIADIVGAGLCFEYFAKTGKPIEAVYSSPVPITYGEIDVGNGHGVMKIPVPAVLNQLSGIPSKKVDIEGEIVTPTGMAILNAAMDLFNKGRKIEYFGANPIVKPEYRGSGLGDNKIDGAGAFTISIGEI